MASAVPAAPPVAPPLENGVPPPPPAQDGPTLTGLQPISAKKTLMIVNSFIINTVDFLNKFTSVAEEKLRKVQQAIQRLEITLALLEGKLDSVPWIASGQPPPAPTPAAPPAGVPAAPSMDSSAASAPSAASPSSPASPPPPPRIAIKDDERYKKYFKMLAMGVPTQALRMKMSADGVDPDVIDMDPEQPAPDGGRAAVSPTSQESPQSSDDEDEDGRGGDSD